MSKKYNSFRIFDFNVKDVKHDVKDDDEDASLKMKKKKKDEHTFMIQMFGKNEKGKTCSINVTGYAPFFYIKIPDKWGIANKLTFMNHLKEKILGDYYKDGLLECKLVKRKKLYGFDGGRQHKFLVLKFANMRVYYKVRGIFYDKQKKLKMYRGFERTTPLELYEANIPPLLRFFHIKEISPSGWISLSNEYKVQTNKTTCDYEYEVNYKNIISLPNKETLVPFKICSFDIEASSSHGDFPLPKKSYKKTARQIIERMLKFDGTDDEVMNYFTTMIMNAFSIGCEDLVDIVYTKKTISEKDIIKGIDLLLNMRLENMSHERACDDSIEKWFNSVSVDENDSYDERNVFKGKHTINQGSLLHLIMSNAEKDEKVERLSFALDRIFPQVEGDKVTFIGSTFTRYGEDKSYLNHCIALDTCSDIANATIES